jgi:hypothetical protein
MFGKLRKPRLGTRSASNGLGQSPSKRDYVLGFDIELDREPNKRVFAARDELRFEVLDNFPYGSQRYIENAPQVEFAIDPNDPSRAVNVRLV